MGFKSRLISARTYGKDKKYSPEFDHLTLIVNLDNEDYLVDVGFGSFSFTPLPIRLNQVISDEHGNFVFESYDSTNICIIERKNDKSNPQFIFSDKERELFEFKQRCEFHQKNKDSHFTKKKVITIAKENGRITLSNTQLKVSQSGREHLVTFREEEFETKLKELFDIEMKHLRKK